MTSGRRYLLRGAALATVLALTGAAAVARKDAIRLVQVSAARGDRGMAVMIESSAPVAYSAHQPDQNTLLVDLVEVNTAGAVVKAARANHDPVAGLSVEQLQTGPLAVARIRIRLNAPASPRLRSVRNTIHIEFETPSSEASLAAQDGAMRALLQPPAAPPAAVQVPSVTRVEYPTVVLDPMMAVEGDAPGTGTASAAPVAATPTLPDTIRMPAPPTSTPVVIVPPAASNAARPAGAAPATSAPAPAAAPAQTQPAPPPPQQPVLTPQGTSQSGQRQYQGHPITMDFQGADLTAVLRTFVDISGLNIVIDPAVQGTVNMSLRDLPWDQALDVILRSHKLGYNLDGNVVRIAPLTVLAEEETQRRKLSEEQALSGELKVETITLSYARAANLGQLLTRTALSPRGQIQVDDRTNTLIITDLAERLAVARNLIGTLDRAEPQVEIEARIVQTTREFARAVGVQLGLTGRVAPELGNTTGLAFPNRGGVTGRTGTSQGPNDPRATVTEGSATAVNLGVNPATSAIGIAMGAVNGAFNLDVALSALERNGKGRVLSTPRVFAQNNTPAEVTQGIQIPIQTVANNTVTVSFKDAALTLRVTPQITSANTVIMQISLENASADFGRQVGGIPPIDTQRAITQVQVADGQTTVIGGIFVSREQSLEDRTPVLHRIPLLGWLFRRNDVRDESRELLIFITPRIIR